MSLKIIVADEFPEYAYGNQFSDPFEANTACGDATNY